MQMTQGDILGCVATIVIVVTIRVLYEKILYPKYIERIVGHSPGIKFWSFRLFEIGLALLALLALYVLGWLPIQ